MGGLILGFDLCNDSSQISCYLPDQKEPEAVELTKSSQMISTVICKRKGREEWMIGEEAYRCALMGEGVIADRLIQLAVRRGSVSIEGVCYQAEQLLEQFLRLVLEIPFQKYGIREIQSITFALRCLDNSLIEILLYCMHTLGVSRERVHFISHTESYIYYNVSQRKDIWANLCCMFDLNEEGLHYYEMQVQRTGRPQMVLASHAELEEGFRLDILDSPAGEKLGDTILCSCAQRLMNKKLFSSVLLTGKGFEKCDQWAPSFTKWICNRRKVFVEPGLFARGAAFHAADQLRENTIYPYCFVCEGRIKATVSMEVIAFGVKRRLILAEAGSSWLNAQSSVEIILDGKNELELSIERVDSAAIRRISIPLDEFPARPGRTTRLELVTSFAGEDQMILRILDRGFGELFPASGQMLRQEIQL